MKTVRRAQTPTLSRQPDIAPLLTRAIAAAPKAGDLARKHGVSEGAIYAWKAKFGAMSVSDAQRLRAPEDENGKLKRRKEFTSTAILAWALDYNTRRPHSSIGDLAPEAFAASLTATGRPAAQYESGAAPPVAHHAAVYNTFNVQRYLISDPLFAASAPRQTPPGRRPRHEPSGVGGF